MPPSSIERLAAEADGRYVVAKLNVDQNPGIATRFDIRGIPTLLIFKGGELIDRVTGVQPYEALRGRMEHYVGAGAAR